MTEKMVYNHEALLRYLLYGALLLVILIGMNQTAYLFNMIFISLILTMIGAPIYYYLKKRGFSDIGAVSSVMAIYGVTIMAFVLLIVYSLNVFIANIGKYRELFQDRLNEVLILLEDAGLHISSFGGFDPDWASRTSVAGQWAAKRGLRFGRWLFRNAIWSARMLRLDRIRCSIQLGR